MVRAKLRHSGLLAVSALVFLASLVSAPSFAQMLTPRPSESIVVLEAPRVSPYIFTAIRDGNAIILSGHVPDDAMRQRLARHAGVDVSELQIGGGAPQSFESAVEFGVAALTLASGGRFVLRDTVLTLSGVAASAASYDNLVLVGNGGAPLGFVLAMAEFSPPLANPFLWSAEKRLDGTIAFTGFVPDRDVQSQLAAAAGLGVLDTTMPADGEPPDFDSATMTGLVALQALESGNVSFDGSRWSINGLAASDAIVDVAEAALATAGFGVESGWSVTITTAGNDVAQIAPEQPAATEDPAVEALSVVDPYLWSVSRSESGIVSMEGFVPSEELRDSLAAAAGSNAQVDIGLARGDAPEDFADITERSLEALTYLVKGEITFESGRWSFLGEAGSESSRLEALAAIEAVDDIATWDVDISVAAEAVAEAEPAPDTTPEIPVVSGSPYTFTAEKAPDGTIRFSGFVPSEDFKAQLASLTSADEDSTALAGGAPEGFIANANAAIAALLPLTEGRAGFDGSTWFLAGAPASEEARAAATGAIATGATDPESWDSRLLSEPPAEETVAVAEAPNSPAAEPEVIVDVVEPEASPPVSVDTEVADVGAAPALAEISEIPEGNTEPAEPVEPVAEIDPTLPEAEAPAEPAPAAVEPFTFLASREAGGEIALSGNVPAESARDYLAALAGRVPSDALTIAPDAPPDFVEGATRGIRALRLIEGGQLSYADGQWTFGGAVDSEELEAQILANIEPLATSEGWSVRLLPTQPLTFCQTRVADLSSRNSILFDSGNARLAESSLTGIDELAAYLARCPDAAVEVEGHTDSDGADDLNLALSVARAEAVVVALIERGIAASRLYAIGYGESLPVSENETSAGKRANRRIVINVVEAARP